MTMNINIFLET